MTKKLKLISGVLFFALMTANICANLYGSWAEQFSYSQRGWEAKEANGKPIIWTVDAVGPAAALRVGDEVVSLEIEPRDACRLINRRETGRITRPAPGLTAANCLDTPCWSIISTSWGKASGRLNIAGMTGRVTMKSSLTLF